MAQTFLNLLTSADISGPETGRSIGELILQWAPDVFPDKIGNWEPIKEACVSTDDFVRFWRFPVLAKKKKPRVSFSVWFRKPRRRYSSIYLDITSGAVGAEGLTNLFVELAKLTKAEVGLIQDVTSIYEARARERGLLRFTDKLKKRFFLHLYEESVAQNIPDAFDTMWLPSEVWIVDSTKLFTPISGLYHLPDIGSQARDEALKHIQKRH